MSRRNDIVQGLRDALRGADEIPEPLWDEVRKALSGAQLDQWLEAFHALREATRERPRVALELVRTAPRIARMLGISAPLDLARAAVEVAQRAGSQAAASMLAHAPRAAVLAGGEQGFHVWLASLRELAAAAPETVHPVCVRTDTLLSLLGPAGLRAWVCNGMQN